MSVPLHATCPTHLTLLLLIAIIFGEECKIIILVQEGYSIQDENLENFENQNEKNFLQ
jgi:hypothetical protein